MAVPVGLCVRVVGVAVARLREWEGVGEVVQDTEMVPMAPSVGVPEAVRVGGVSVKVRMSVREVDRVGGDAEGVTVGDGVPEALRDRVARAEAVALRECVTAQAPEGDPVIETVSVAEPLVRVGVTVPSVAVRVALRVPDRVCVRTGVRVSVGEGLGLRVGLPVAVRDALRLGEPVAVPAADALGEADAVAVGVHDPEAGLLLPVSLPVGVAPGDRDREWDGGLHDGDGELAAEGVRVGLRLRVSVAVE